MTIKRSKKTESDREKRLAQSLGDSKYVISTIFSFSTSLFVLKKCRRGFAEALLAFRARNLK
jgi:hypothetical protein